MNYVDDVINAFFLAAIHEEANGQVYNLGSPEPVSLKKIVETLIQVCGRGSYHLVPFPPEKKRIDIGSYYADYSKIKRELGWAPQISLKEGLRRTIRYFKRNIRHYWE